MKRVNNMMKSLILLSIQMVLIITFWGCTCDDNEEDNNDEPQEVWVDPKTGFMWQIRKYYYSSHSQYDCEKYCDKLKWGNYHDWRMPSISELRSLIRGCPYTETGGECGVTDDCLSEEDCWSDICSSACESGGGPGEDGAYMPMVFGSNAGHCMSSSDVEDDINSGDYWVIGFSLGLIYPVKDDDTLWDDGICVRDVN